MQPQLPQVFSVRGFEALYSPNWNPGLLGLSRSPVPVYLHPNVGPPILPAPPCCKSSLPQQPISAPPTSLDECFFFNSLVVSLPYSFVLWQFCLFLVFKFVVVLLLVVRGGTVCLPMPPSLSQFEFYFQ